MKQALKLILIVVIAWGLLEILAVIFGFWVFGTSVKKLDQIDHSKGKQYNITLTSSQKQANDASQSTTITTSESAPDGQSQASSYSNSQGQCQDTNGNWKFVDKYNNPMPSDWQPSDGTDYQMHLNTNYQGE